MDLSQSKMPPQQRHGAPDLDRHRIYLGTHASNLVKSK
jgi:hypothetical protein